jgi:hypothetical protein
VWIALKDWLSLYDVNPRDWKNMNNVEDWWMQGVHKMGQSRKAMVSLAMLVSWEIWKERNTHASSKNQGGGRRMVPHQC